ncbi:hypothetical protein KUTeg_022118 [Tegillarca granosa]|uniref:Zinc finger CCCH-type with G patch domain-containing protein n=1 Tax=Tegillarca granosa TaxID=220873 RepID=A0ABQ9E898_TEGGR|nr:hypothetical protein KUTeg_022118 [Tegillarca granosa]
MNEASLEASLELYTSQLAQVDQTLEAAGDNNDLIKLKTDLLEVIQLTQEGLLSLKKSNILKEIDDGQSASCSITSKNKSDSKQKNSKLASSSEAGKDNTSSDNFDDEYAAFQNTASTAHESSSHKQDIQGTSNNLIYSEELKDLIGTRCRAPFVHEWGSTSYYNAVISGIDQADSTMDLPKVHVMFCNPTHTSMLPCEYYLDNKCKFTDEKCRFSHGYSVKVEELQEFQEPDYSALDVDSPCLAKYDDGLWYRAQVQSIDEDHQVTVTYDSYDETVTLDLKDILPLGKSLDKIMELKELAGEQDLFDVMKRLEKKKKQQEKKEAKKSQKPKEKINVFDFINKKLGGKKGNIKDLVLRHHTHHSNNQLSHRNISEKELHSRSDRNLNVQLFKTQEEMKNVEKKINHLKKSLLRHTNRDKKMADHTKKEIQAMEEYLQRPMNIPSSLFVTFRKYLSSNFPEYCQFLSENDISRFDSRFINFCSYDNKFLYSNNVSGRKSYKDFLVICKSYQVTISIC